MCNGSHPRYIRLTRFLTVAENPHNNGLVEQLVDYTDVEWASDALDEQSTSGFMFSLGSVLLSRNNKKQPTVALLSTKAEYRGAKWTKGQQKSMLTKRDRTG